jgi:hypothetical protein
MKHDPRLTQETLQLEFDPTTFKTLLRDLVFREAGKPYFKHFAIPRHSRWLGAWRRLPTYQAECQLLPVGGHHFDQRIREFFLTYGCLRAVFQASGMPVTAVQVLRQRCPVLNAALEQIQHLECALKSEDRYAVLLTGGLLLYPLPEETFEEESYLG